MKDFIDFLKLPPNILGALSIASGTLLLLPQKLAQKFFYKFSRKIWFYNRHCFCDFHSFTNRFITI